MKKYGLFINGNWVQSLSGNTFETKPINTFGDPYVKVINVIHIKYIYG